MADHLTESQRQDIADLALGKLSEERATALLAAARQDPNLMRALREEEALEKLLDLYEFPEVPKGLEKRFWERFQQEKLEGETLGSGRTWWLRIAAPVAAAILLAIGLIYLPPDTPANDPVKVGGNPPVETPAEPEAEEDLVLPLLGADEPNDKPKELKPEELKLLKAMDDARLQALGDLQDPEDVRLVDTLETLETIEPQKE